MKSAGHLPRQVAARRERVVALRERHRARVEPGVDDLGLPAHRRRRRGTGAATVLVHERRCGSKGSGERRGGALRELGELTRRTSTCAAVAAAPERQRGAPVAVARDRPVDVALEPLAEAARPDLRRGASRLRVELQHRSFTPWCGRTRRCLRVVEERRAAAPAVGVGVAVQLGAEQQAAGVEVGDQVGVGLLHQAVGEDPDGVGEAAVGPDRVAGRPARASTGGGHVVLAEGRRDVDDAGAVARA